MNNKKSEQNVNYGQKLKKAREALGLTQEKVAEYLGLGPRYISDIERNKTKGYRTNLSLKTQETWNYAQRIFAVIWMIFGVCLAGLIVLCNFIIPISHEIRSVIFVVASISVMMCCTPITEGMIKRKFRGQLNGL